MRRDSPSSPKRSVSPIWIGSPSGSPKSPARNQRRERRSSPPLSPLSRRAAEVPMRWNPLVDRSSPPIASGRRMSTGKRRRERSIDLFEGEDVEAQRRELERLSLNKMYNSRPEGRHCDKIYEEWQTCMNASAPVMYGGGSNDGCPRAKKPSDEEMEIINDVLPVKKLIALSGVHRLSGGGRVEYDFTVSQKLIAGAAAIMASLAAAGVSAGAVYYALYYTGYLGYVSSALELADQALKGCGTVQGTVGRKALNLFTLGYVPDCAEIHANFNALFNGFLLKAGALEVAAAQGLGMVGVKTPTYSNFYNFFLHAFFTPCGKTVYQDEGIVRTSTHRRRSLSRSSSRNSITRKRTPKRSSPSSARRQRRRVGSSNSSAKSPRKTGGGGRRSKTCNRRNGRSCRKKYVNRPSPPYPANDHCGEKKLGNDGHYWRSKPDYRGVCTWRPV